MWDVRDDGPAAECRCDGGQPRNFLRPCLLLLLRESPAHGYDLIERLGAFGFSRSDPGGVYRALRSLEREGLVRSGWETSGAGPARRTYELTPEGERMLHAWARRLEESRQVLVEYLDRYVLATSGAPEARPARAGA